VSERNGFSHRAIAIQSTPIATLTESFPTHWINELGSNVSFQLNYGMITGVYQTAVVSKPEKNDVPLKTNLFGTYQEVPNGLLITFNVQWKFTDKMTRYVGSTSKSLTKEVKHSTTTWIGRWYATYPSELDTTWILQSDKPVAESWSSVTINKDKFRST
jgi:hypothetical protein